MTPVVASAVATVPTAVVMSPVKAGILAAGRVPVRVLVPNATVNPAPVLPPVNTPVDVREEVTTLVANVVPVKVLASAVTVILAEPLKDTPLIVRGVCNTVAVPALPVTKLWSPLFVPLTLEVPATVKVKVPVANVPLPVILTPFNVVAVAAPKTGAISVGVLLKTTRPVPVSSLMTPANCKLVVGANWFKGLAVCALPAVPLLAEVIRPLASTVTVARV